MAETFQQRFCRHFDLPAERYGAEALRLTLYPHARWLWWFRGTDFLAADRAFVAAIGRLTHRQNVGGEVRDFARDPQNRSFWRRIVRLRVSAARMQTLASTIWEATAIPVPSAADKLRADLHFWPISAALKKQPQPPPAASQTSGPDRR